MGSLNLYLKKRDWIKMESAQSLQGVQIAVIPFALRHYTPFDGNLKNYIGDKNTVPMILIS